LIVRELLRAPKRYGQLLDALPGIGTNLLVNRLRELEAAGVLGRVLAPSPQSAVVYELSERGRALQADGRRAAGLGRRELRLAEWPDRDPPHAPG
jgi:DNA-binding HxlR family transcriptional regulator